MLSVKFKKLKPAAYMSHMDMQRAINRTLKRAGIDLIYSKGFNPHAFLKLSLPIPLGLESEAEFVTIDAMGATVNDIVDRMNTYSPVGFEFIKAWETEKNPNFAAGIVATDYLISLDLSESYKERIFEGVKRSLVTITTKDGVTTEKESYNLVLGLVSVQNGFIARLAAGINTLRADRFIEAINRQYDLALTLNNVKKIRTYYNVNGDYVPTEYVLDDMSAPQTQK